MNPITVPAPPVCLPYGFTREDVAVRALITARANLTAAHQQLLALRRWRLLGPLTAAAFVAAVYAAATAAGGQVTLWLFVLLGAAFAGVVRWILTAAHRSQVRAVLRADAIHDGALSAAARKGVHLEAVRD